MRARHSIEIKTLLEERKSQMKRDIRDSDTNVTTYSHNHSNTLKSSESTSTLVATHASDISLIQDRYTTL